MEITETLYVEDRAAWRAWLAENHATAKEIWLITYGKTSDKPSVPYLDAVEEALCFGWIDGIAKKMDAERTAQRFTPRRPNSNWTELNKERARRLIAAGLMTEAGRAVLPDLSLEAFSIAPDILAALQADPQTWQHFQEFPAVYQRIRVGYIEEQRKQPQEFERRLNNFLQKTKEGKMFGVVE
ncbi:MAG: YdeI/OmpD-associated family protein [bacterium]|nr:YdeI/OmpD-associated family protein [bacterium]